MANVSRPLFTGYQWEKSDIFVGSLYAVVISPFQVTG